MPWHRLYLLDLERQLQAVRPAVTLPYWQFDQAAPNLFTEDFMGAMDRIPRDSRQPGGEFDPGGTLNPVLARFTLDDPSFSPVGRSAMCKEYREPRGSIRKRKQQMD